MSDKKKITQQLLSNSNYYKMHDRNKLTSQKYTKKFDNLVQETGKVLVFNIQQHNWPRAGMWSYHVQETGGKSLCKLTI